MVNFQTREACPLCRSKYRKTLLTTSFADPRVKNFIDNYYGKRIPKFDFPYEIIKCRRCQFVWQRFILSSDDLQKLYDSWIDPKWSYSRQVSYGTKFFRSIASDVSSINFLIKKSPPEINILDFGMGWGHWCQAAKSFGYRVYGLELSKTRTNYARKSGIKVFDSLSKLPTNFFDYINAEQVFEHLAAPLETLQKLSKSLRSKGVIHIGVPNGRGVEEKVYSPDWQAGHDAIQPLEHVNCFTRPTLKRLGETAGLKLIAPPYLLVPNPTAYEIIRSIGGYIYRLYWDTSVYFQKL